MVAARRCLAYDLKAGRRHSGLSGESSKGVGNAQVVSSRIVEQTHVFGRTTFGTQTASWGPASASEFTGTRTGIQPLILEVTAASLGSSDGAG